MNWKTVIGALAVGAFVLPSVADAGPPDCRGHVTQRPIADFLEAQGTNSTFFPPVPDYVGWTDGDFTTFALIDYAGLANDYIDDETGTSLGTETLGLVKERECVGGEAEVVEAEVNVKLFTKNALGFAQNIQDILKDGFAAAPTIFGNKAVDVVAEDADAALGSATLDVTFRIAAPGAALPDLLDVVNTNDYDPVKLHFHSVTFDQQSVLHVHQKAATDDESGELVYSQEVVKIVPDQADDD